jgi:CheY-like chemotaxis protein
MRRPILVVDDDPGLREILELALYSEGYSVLVARDGLEALATIEDELPSLVLLDWMMPRLDGPGFARELDRRGLRGRVPILLLTAANGAEERAAQISAESVLAKPFELPDLLGEVDRLAGAAPCR